MCQSFHGGSGRLPPYLPPCASASACPLCCVLCQRENVPTSIIPLDSLWQVHPRFIRFWTRADRRALPELAAPRAQSNPCQASHSVPSHQSMGKHVVVAVRSRSCSLVKQVRPKPPRLLLRGRHGGEEGSKPKQACREGRRSQTLRTLMKARCHPCRCPDAAECVPQVSLLQQAGAAAVVLVNDVSPGYFAMERGAKDGGAMPLASAAFGGVGSIA